MGACRGRKVGDNLGNSCLNISPISTSRPLLTITTDIIVASICCNLGCHKKNIFRPPELQLKSSANFVYLKAFLWTYAVRIYKYWDRKYFPPEAVQKTRSDCERIQSISRLIIGQIISYIKWLLIKIKLEN